MRIAYFHSHLMSNERGALNRYMAAKSFGYVQQEKDARDALYIVREFFREESPDAFSDLDELPAIAAKYESRRISSSAKTKR